MKYKTPAALEMAVRNAARESPMDTNRAIVGFYFHRFLCRVFSEDDGSFVLKGGQSVLARTLDARVTRDIDLVAQEESLEEAIVDLVQAASIDLEDFVSFVFDRAEQIKEEDEYRCGAKVWFTPFMGTKKLQPISIDLVIDEVRGLEPEVLAPIDRLNIEGLPVLLPPRPIWKRLPLPTMLPPSTSSRRGAPMTRPAVRAIARPPLLRPSWKSSWALRRTRPIRMSRRLRTLRLRSMLPRRSWRTRMKP